MKRDLMLIFVAIHPSGQEIDQLLHSMQSLPPEIAYAEAVNHYSPGESVDRLERGADLFIRNSDNLGYGRAVNRLFRCLKDPPNYLAILNTDLSWRIGTFSVMLRWMRNHLDVSLIVPQILDPSGHVQKLCKQHPTVLGLLSRRFLPEFLKPLSLKKYDSWYVMDQFDYSKKFDVPYLSGCCMFIRASSFICVGGFDERYFLYLEDADITRSLAKTGRCLHFPDAVVVHGWGRGNYRSFRLMVVNIVSAFLYFSKWGLSLW